MIHALLTIDDVASQNTPEIVDYLKEKGIRAIMFATGQNVEQYYEEAKYALKSGMVIGNHSYSHPRFSTITMEECAQELDQCEQVLDRLYQDCGVERAYRPFRFPYGDKGGANRDSIQRYLRENGFDKVDDTKIPYPWWTENGLNRDIDTLWTYDFEEYRIRPGSDFTWEAAWEKLHDRNPVQGAALLQSGGRHILLLHAHDDTEKMVPRYYQRFINELLAHGVVFDEPAFL